MRSAAVADDLISMAPPRKIACMLSNARLRAKKKGVPFDFSRDDLKAALSRQGWKCALSGLDLRFDGPGSDRRLVPSMDRIVPAKGYVRGNVRIVCHAVNIARHEWGDAGFLEICRAVVTKAEARQ